MTKLLPVPPSVQELYDGWLGMFPESMQHGTLDLFYAFVRVVLFRSRADRDGRWLRATLERDAPSLSAEALDFYCSRFDVICEYEATTFKRSQVLRTWAVGRFEERREKLLREATARGETSSDVVSGTAPEEGGAAARRPG